MIDDFLGGEVVKNGNEMHYFIRAELFSQTKWVYVLKYDVCCKRLHVETHLTLQTLQ